MPQVDEVLKTTGSLLEIAPAVLQLIIALEAIFKSHPKSGPSKKAVVLAAIPTILQNTASTFIDTAVAQMNSVQVSGSGTVNTTSPNTISYKAVAAQ